MLAAMYRRFVPISGIRKSFLKEVEAHLPRKTACNAAHPHSTKSQLLLESLKAGSDHLGPTLLHNCMRDYLKIPDPQRNGPTKTKCGVRVALSNQTIW